MVGKAQQPVDSKFSLAHCHGGDFNPVLRLDKDPYDETHPKIPCWTRHSEFLKDSKRAGPMGTAVAAWTFGFRSQTPACDARRGHPALDATDQKSLTGARLRTESALRATARREREAQRREREVAPRVWNQYFQQRECSLDMLRTRYEEADPEGKASISATPRQEAAAASSSATPRRQPRVHCKALDSTALVKTHEEWNPKVPGNANYWMEHERAGDRTEVMRYMLSMR